MILVLANLERSCTYRFLHGRRLVVDERLYVNPIVQDSISTVEDKRYVHNLSKMAKTNTVAASVCPLTVCPLTNATHEKGAPASQPNG